MLASQPGRYVSESSGVLRCRSILYCVAFLLLAFLHDPVISEEAQCTKSTLRDHLRKSFKVFKLGRTRNIRSCINLCCSRRNCDLALLRNTRCYGISCSHHDLCRSILNGLREKRHEISKRSVDDTEDIPSDFSHHPRHHGFCRHRRVVPHHIFLEGGRGVSKFHKLATDVSSSRECNQYCCQRTDCSLAFIMRDKCYGVICPGDGDCESGEEERVPVHLEIALLERRGSFDEASRVVDSDVDKKPSLSERRHHRYHHHDDPAEDDTSYSQEHETQLPKKHHLRDGSTIPLHHHHHHHHHVHKSTYNPGVRESDSQSSSQESDHKRRHVKTHRHQNSEEREDSNQDNENDNSYKHREGERHRHHHRKVNMEDEKINRMHHHRNVEHGTNHDSNERDDTIEKQSKSHRHTGHHKHVKMNSDMKYDNEDKDSEISSRHSIRKRKHHRQDKMDYFESPEDDRGRDAPLKKKHRKQERHKSGGNSEGNDDEEEQSGTHRRKKSRPPEHHHLDEVNYNHEEKSMNSEDIMEFGDNDNDDGEKMNRENFPRKHDKADHENESSENEDFEHEQRNEDQDKDMNKDEDESEGTFTKNKNQHEDSHETSQEKTDYKKHHQTGRESLSSESKMRNNEMQDESEDDDEESPKEHKTRGEDKEDHYDEEMNDEDGHFGSGDDEEERSKIEHEKDSNERRDENMNDDGMENRKNINHREKEENEMVDYNHNHHHDHDEDDIQAQTNEYHHHHHHHNANVQDQNDDNTKHNKKEEKEQHRHHHHSIHDQHHRHQHLRHHHHIHHENQAMNSEPDMNEMKNTDNEMSGNKIKEHHHHHHDHHHQKKPIKEHQERMTIKKQHKDNHRQYENEYQEYSGSGDDSDNENIMSQNYAHRMHEPNHNYNHEDKSDDRSDVKDNDEDKNFKSSKKKAKDYNPSKGENYGSSKKEKKSEDVFKNKKPNSREKEKMDKIEDNDNSEDKEGERNTIHNEEADSSEPKSKIHVHHESDKDDDEGDSKEKIASDEENKIEKNKIKESISKKGNGKTSKHELDNDEINDNDSEEDSKKNRNFKNKDDESDENQSEYKDRNKAGNEQRHYKKEREDHLHKEHRKNYDNWERKNTEHVQGERKYNEHHVEKETKYNSDVKDSQHKESKESKGKQELAKEHNENTEHRDQKQGGPLEVNHDHKNAKHHQKKMKSSNGKIEDIKSNMDNRMKHESNNNQRSKADNNDSNGHTDDRDSDDSEDSNDDAKQNHEYNSKVSTHDEHIHNKQEKHHTEKSHGYFESENENYDNDQKNRESQTVGVREEAGPKNNNRKKSDREDNGIERGHLSRDSSESKSDEMKNKNSHATTSEHVDHKDNEDNEKEKESKNEDHKENLSKNEDHKENLSKNEDHKENLSKNEDHKENLSKNEDHKKNLSKNEDHKENLSKNEDHKKNLSKNEDHKKNLSKNEDHKKNLSKNEDHKKNLSKNEDHKKNLSKNDDHKKNLSKNDDDKENLSKDEVHKENLSKNEVHKENLSKNEDHKKSKSNENNRKDDEISSDHVDHKESYGDNKSKNTGRDKGNSEDDEGKDESTNENRKENESSKTEDADGIRRDHVYHVDHETSSSIEKKYAGSKHHTKANKDKNSSETTEENGMEHSGRKNGYKNRENIEEKHEVSSNSISGSKHHTKANKDENSSETTDEKWMEHSGRKNGYKNRENIEEKHEISSNGISGSKHHTKANKDENSSETTEENGMEHSGKKNGHKNRENTEEKHEVSSNGISGSKHHTKANKYENSSETTEENGMEHSGRKNDYKNRENIEEKHEVSRNKIEITKDNRTSHGKENTIIPFKHEETTEHLNKNTASKGTNSEIQKNGTAGNKHKNFMHNKLDNKFENTHEPREVENGFNKDETGSSKKLTKQDEHEFRNNSYDNKEKGEPLESEEKRITGKHKVVAIQKVTTEDGSSKTNVNEHSNINQDQTNNPPRIDDNTNVNNTQSAIEKQNDKHHRKNSGKNVPGEIIDIMDNNEQDKSNTGYPQHKPLLYHSLNELKDIKSNNGQKKKMEGISPEVNHDIMKSNQNYTEATKPKKTEEGSEADKTRFFNQETNEWKESFKGDQVDESGKYFNQRTRGWSVNQPKTNTDYFHNLTSQWNLENKTKPSDFGKYFNQRTKTWLGKKVGHAYRKNLGDTIGSVKEKDSNTLHINGSMKGNKEQSSRKKILSSTNNNHKKHKQNITVYKPVQKHKLQSTIPKDEEGKSSQVIHNNTKIRKQFNHSKTSGTVIPTKVKKKVTKVKSASHKAKDSETAEEKVKNEILKLIGEAPAKTTSSHKKTKNIGHRLINKHLESSVNVSTRIDNILPRKPENIPQPRTILTSPENITNALPQHQAKPYKPRIVGHDKILVGKFPHVPRKKKVLKTSKSTTKVKSKEEFDAKRPHGTKMTSLPPKSKEKNRINSTRKEKIGPLLKQPQRKPIRPTQPLAIPIKHHLKFPRIRKKPVNSINRVRPTTQPGVHTWKGTLEKPSYTPTVNNIGKYDYQNWNKQNTFDNEWNNAKWNSYYNTYGSNSILHTPTVKPTLSWNSMLWNSNSNQQGNIINGYQNGGTEGRGQGITPTIAPINTGGNANRNSQINRVHNYLNGGIEGKFRGMRPTLAPVNRNKQFPFTFDGTSKSGKGHQIGGMGNTPRVLGPTLAPPYRQRESSLNRNGGLNRGGKDQSGGHRVPVLRPTFAPPYRLGGFPLTKNGDRTNRIDYWNQNFKSPFERQGPPVGSHPSGTETKNGDMTNKRKDFWNQNIKTPSEVGRNTLDKTAPRSHVYYSENKQRVSNLTQNHVMKPPRKPSSSQLTGPRAFVHPLGNVTSLIPTKNVPDQPASIRNNYWKQHKVSSSGKMNSSQVQQTSKTIPILRRPTLPPHLTRKPNQWNKTRTTSGIHHPFKVNKIESLHGVTKDRLHPNVPKGCFPGEIMSEMTLENGLDAGNYTNLGRTELMDSCISKCCEIKSCEVAVQMDNVCFALKCHSKESCKIKTTLGKSSHHKLCFLSRKKKERQNIFDFDNDILGEQDVCHQEQAVGLNWKTTNAGTFDEIPCPKKAKGLAKRKCSIESHWLLPDFSSCVSNAYEELYQRAKRLVYGEDSSSLLQSLVIVTTRTIDNSLIFGGDLKKTTEIMTAIVQEQGARQDGGISLKNVKNYLITCSNLLDDSNKQEWRNIQNDARGSADILRDSQTYALIASSKLPETRTNLTYVTNNIVVQMSYQEKGSNDKIFPDYTNTDVALWDGEKDNIRLPKSVFSIGNIKTVTFSYKTLPALLPMDSKEHFRHSEPNSKILATIAEPRIQDKITPAITITLHHLKQNRLNPKCVFWDFNLNPVHGGAWSTEGCWLESSTKEHTVCRCDHLANFAVLMDVVDSGSMQASAKDERYSKEMAAMWICIPVSVVLVIAALYIASTWSRGPRRRTLSERSSLLRSSVTTDEVRYDYSSTPSHNLEGTTPPKLKELEWQNEFNKDVERMKDIGLEFDSSHQRMRDGQEMEHDSGIESNDHDDSHCDLSLSQENLEIREEQFQGYLEDIHYTESILDSGITSPADSHANFIQEKQTIHLDVERRIFPTNLRRCCGQEDLSSPKK